MPFEEVEYETHFNQLAAQHFTGKDAENDRYFVNKAKNSHIAGVNRALGDLFFDASAMIYVVPFNKDAEDFLRFGVMRRMLMLRSSFCNFQNIITPDRLEPLTLEQSTEVCRDLNAIYINILGLLDNYTWTMVHHAGSEATRASKPMAIGLFKPALTSDPALAATAKALTPFAAWEEEVKTRRNPAAHRMPLYVPLASHTREERIECERYEQQISIAIRAQEFERVPEIEGARLRIGTLNPVFLHDPGEDAIEIYPTLPQDIGQMVKIGRIVQKFLREHNGASLVARTTNIAVSDSIPSVLIRDET